MTLTKNFDEKYREIVELVENEIKEGYNGNKSLHQFKSIIIDLEKMKEIRNSRQFKNAAVSLGFTMTSAFTMFVDARY